MEDDIKFLAYDLLNQLSQSGKNPLPNQINTKTENQNLQRNKFFQNPQKSSPHKQYSLRQKQIANQLSKFDEYETKNIESITIQNPEQQLLKFRTSLNKMKDSQMFNQSLKKNKLYGVSTRWRYEKSLSKNRQETFYNHKISETLSQFSKNFIINYPSEKDQSPFKQTDTQEKTQQMQQECLKILQIQQINKQLPKVIDTQIPLVEEGSGCFLKPRSAKMLNRIQSIRTKRRFFDSSVPTPPPANGSQIMQQCETVSSKDFFQYAFPNTPPIRKIPFTQTKQRILKTENDQDEQTSSQSIFQRSNPRSSKDNFFKSTFGSSQNQLNLSSSSQQSRCVFKNFVQPKEIQTKPTRMPLISAKCFVLMDADTENKTNVMIQQIRLSKERQVASLTKIATCFTALKIIQELELDDKELFFKVPRIASRIKGTSANLKFKDIISLSDTFFGMMLPSGNDAATLISEALGYLLFLRKFNKDHLIRSDRVIDLDFEYEQNQEVLQNEKQEGKNLDESFFEIRTFVDSSHNNEKESFSGFSTYFIQQMNNWAQKLDMKRTYFATPHGLANRNNLSCAIDIAKLSIESMKLPKFKSIVSCKDHICKTKRPLANNQFKEIQYRWSNTNKLLEKGFNGIKTGITDIAGPCLAASTSIETIEGPKNLIIVVICSQTQDQRFEDVQKISNWAKKYIFESQN